MRVLFFGLALWAAVVAGRAETPAGETRSAGVLRELVARQQSLLARAAAATDEVALHDLRPQFQRLIWDYERYLRDYPNVALGYASYAMLLGHELLDERRRAVALLLRANELNPDLPLVKNQLGNFLAEEGRPEEAINYYLAAVQLMPDEPLYHFQVGRLLAVARDSFVRSGAWDEAVIEETMHEALARAVALAPENLEYALQYAKSYYELRHPDWPRALELWRQLERRTHTPLGKEMMRVHQAQVLRQLGRDDEAQAVLATVTAPELTEAKAAVLADPIAGEHEMDVDGAADEDESGEPARPADPPVEPVGGDAIP
jgi:tetratricopeptide (TPR) repeat protein